MPNVKLKYTNIYGYDNVAPLHLKINYGLIQALKDTKVRENIKEEIEEIQVGTFMLYAMDFIRHLISWDVDVDIEIEWTHTRRGVILQYAHETKRTYHDWTTIEFQVDMEADMQNQRVDYMA